MRILLTASIFCLSAASGGAQGLPRFTIETPVETRPGAALVSLDADGLGIDDAGARIKLPRFIELRREGRTLPPILITNFLLTTTGDRIPLDASASATLDENRLLVWPAKSSLPAAHAKGLSLYVPNVALLFWTLPEGVDDAERFFAQLAEEPRKRDIAFLKNGDRIEGTLIAVGPKTGCVMTVASKRVETPWSKLAGFAWNTERQIRPRTKKPYARVILEGGSRASFTDLRFDPKSRQWTGKTLFGTVIDWPEENLLAIDMRQDAAVDLSELAPVRYEHQPYLGASWPLVKDAAAAGHALRLGNNSYEKGLGTHAPCRVTYKLAGQYQRFDALVGIDDQARRGRAKIALELDGKRIDLNDGKEITNKDAASIVRQDVRNVRELTLIVELGSFGDVEAHVNWAKARLVKRE